MSRRDGKRVVGSTETEPFGWTICNATALFFYGENANQDRATWRLAPDGSKVGELVSGLGDARCTATTKLGVTYSNTCLEQFIAPTMRQVAFPNNAVQKTFNTTGVKIPN